MLHGGPGVQSIRNLVFDGLQRLSPRAPAADPPVLIVDIDEESLRRLGQWPWPRDRLARGLARLHELGPAAVTLDVLLSEPDRTSPDQILASWPDLAREPAVAALLGSRSTDAQLAAAMGGGPSVVGFALSDKGGGSMPPTSGFAQAGAPALPFVPRFGGAVPPVPPIAQAAAGLGAVNWIPDRDLVVRRVPLVFAAGETLAPSLALETLRVAQRASTVTLRSTEAGINALRVGALIVPTDPDGSVRVRYSGQSARPQIPFWRLLEPDGLDRAAVAGRIVMVGASAAALGDIRATPLEGSVPGMLVHAEVIEQILEGQHLVRPDYAAGIELTTLLIGAFFATLFARRFRPMTAALSMLGVAALPWAGTWFAFSRGGWLYDPAIPTATIGVAYVIATVLGYMRTEGERRQIREAFSHYVAPKSCAPSPPIPAC